jgi:hypothetical protein
MSFMTVCEQRFGDHIDAALRQQVTRGPTRGIMRSMASRSERKNDKKTPRVGGGLKLLSLYWEGNSAGHGKKRWFKLYSLQLA